MFIACATRNRKIFWIGVIVSLIASYALCVHATEVKWGIRRTTATFESELEIATSDGANLVFAAVTIAPLQAVIVTWLWSAVGRRIWKRQRS